MGYMISIRDQWGRLHHHHEPDRFLAADVIDTFLTDGFEIVAIQAPAEPIPLSIDDVLRRHKAKAHWRKLYGENIYAREEAWTRDYLATRRPSI